jgi:hypothetical protein
MYYKLKAHITINTTAGKTINFFAVNNVEIDKSIDKIESIAKVRIPTSARLSHKDLETESVQTASVFNRGDKINIKLAYNDNFTEEFEGFISRINFTTPLEIECEGYEFLLRDEIPTKTFASTNLKEVLHYVISGNDLELAGDIPEVNMTDYIIPADITGLEALRQLKESYGLTIFLNKNVVYAGLDFVRYSGDVKYSLGVNTQRTDELKYQRAEDVKLKVKAVFISKDNTRYEIEVGDKNGELRTRFFYDIKSQSDLKKLAEAEIQKYKYTGYTGKITTFLEPFSCPGMVAEIIDIKYPERNGKYEIRSVTTSFGTSGARRTVEIGKTLS